MGVNLYTEAWCGPGIAHTKAFPVRRPFISYQKDLYLAYRARMVGTRKMTTPVAHYNIILIQWIQNQNFIHVT